MLKTSISLIILFSLFNQSNKPIESNCERIEIKYKDSHEHVKEVYEELVKNGKDSILMYGHWDMQLVKNKRFIFSQEEGKTIVIPIHDKVKRKYPISIKDECIEINNLEIFEYCEGRINNKLQKPKLKASMSHYPVFYWKGKIGNNEFNLRLSDEVQYNLEHETVKFINFIEDYIDKEDLNRGFYEDNKKLLKRKNKYKERKK